MLRRSWVEIDLEKLKNNYSILKTCVPETAQIMAVVKADAYGHGDGKCSVCLQDLGVSFFAVSNINEAVNLREAGIKGEIIVLGYTPIDLCEQLEKYDITQTIISEDYGAEIAKVASKKLKCHVAIDTGMRRIGVDALDIELCSQTIRTLANRLNVKGIFTHLCVADSTNEEDVLFTKKQIALFESVADSLIDLNLTYVHCMNSAGGLTANSKYNNLIRFGIVLYGLHPSGDVDLPNGVKPVLSWKSVVTMIKDVSPGDTVGYGRTFKVNKQMRIAVIPTGYADGYPRSLSNKGCVFIRGEKANIVGRICMDQMMVDVTDIKDVAPEDEVVLIGEDYTADNLAQDAGTIGYEILCNITNRVDMVYLEKI